MKTYLKWLPIALLAAGCGSSGDTKKENEFNVNPTELQKEAKTTFGTLPEKMPGGERDTPEQVALGEKLYFDVRLSVNDKQSCNTCHPVDGNKFGVDNKSVSEGALGTPGTRNSPTVLNSGYQFVQFWDGRAATLEAQAKGPILNPIEMGMPDSGAVVKKLSSIQEYVELFAKAFPGNQPITYDNTAKAIASYERTLRTSDRFDQFLFGGASALNNQELGGLDLFMKTGCTTCHGGPLLGGNIYQKMGVKKEYGNQKDLGRFDLTHNEVDKMMFKVPSLRNVAQTGPYFHDGSVAKLEDAVAQMAELELGKTLKQNEINAITAFLGALTDKDRLGAVPAK